MHSPKLQCIAMNPTHLFFIRIANEIEALLLTLSITIARNSTQFKWSAMKCGIHMRTNTLQMTGYTRFQTEPQYIHTPLTNRKMIIVHRVHDTRRQMLFATFWYPEPYNTIHFILYVHSLHTVCMLLCMLLVTGCYRHTRKYGK